VVVFPPRTIILPASTGSVDTVSWKAIDSVHYNKLRNGFDTLEKIYGTYVLSKDNPWDTVSQIFDIIFTHLVNVDSVVYYVLGIDTSHWVRCGFTGGYRHNDSYVGESIIFPNPVLELYPNPSTGILSLKINNSGSEKHDLYITDMLGRVVLQLHSVVIIHGETININVYQLNNGAYIMHWGPYQKLVIVQK
jgi:hypothetical protein